MYKQLKRLSDLLAHGGKSLVMGGSVSVILAVGLARLLIHLGEYDDEDFEWLSEVDVTELTHPTDSGSGG